MISHLQSPDVLGIWNYTNKNKDAQKRVKLLLGNLTYACRYWAQHVALCELDPLLVDLLCRFFYNNLLCWIECLSVIGGLDRGISSLPGAIKILSVCCFVFYYMGEINFQTSSLPTTYQSQLSSCYLMHILLWCISMISFWSLQCTSILHYS